MYSGFSGLDPVGRRGRGAMEIRSGWEIRATVSRSPRTGTRAERAEVGNGGSVDSSPKQKCHASLKTLSQDLSWSLGDVSLLPSDWASEGMFRNLELIISSTLPLPPPPNPRGAFLTQHLLPRRRIETQHPVCHLIFPVTQAFVLPEATWKVSRNSKPSRFSCSLFACGFCSSACLRTARMTH